MSWTATMELPEMGSPRFVGSSLREGKPAVVKQVNQVSFKVF